MKTRVRADGSGRTRAPALVLALALCVALAGCFMSEAPLYDARKGAPVFGKGRVIVAAHQPGEEPDANTLEWTPEGYIEPGKPEDGATSFHQLGWFSSLYVSQSASGKSGYMYNLYRKERGRMLDYAVACKDLTPAEAQAAHMVRNQSGDECTVTRASDLAQAFRLLAKRKQAQGYLARAKAE